MGGNYIEVRVPWSGNPHAASFIDTRCLSGVDSYSRGDISRAAAILPVSAKQSQPFET
jgi:hypothetical protein